MSCEPQFLGESDSLKFSGCAEWNLGENEDLARDLVCGHALRGEVAQLSVAGLRSLAQHNRGRDVFAEHVVGHRERHALVNRGMFHDDFIDLAR